MEFFKKAVSAMLAVIMIFFCVPSAFAITAKDAYEYGAGFRSFRVRSGQMHLPSSSLLPVEIPVKPPD